MPDEAEIIPFEPDPDNAGVGIGNCDNNLSHILKGSKGCGFFNETPISEAKRTEIGKSNYPADAGFEGMTMGYVSNDNHNK